MSREVLPMAGLLSKKRTSAEDNDDEQTNEDSDALFQKEDNAKRARLALLSDSTLQDLPNELLECILVKVVVMEVMDLRLIKSVWKDKADLAISRLKPVSSHWTSILSTNSFRNKLHRALDRTAEVSIRLETLFEYTIHIKQPSVLKLVTTLNDELFTCIAKHRIGKALNFVINVYNRDNLAKLKDVIPLEEQPECMTSCRVSNCVYVGLYNGNLTLSVIRISKGDNNQFNIAPFTINDPELSIYHMQVGWNGSLIILPVHTAGRNRTVDLVKICDSNGCVQRNIKLPRDAVRQVTDGVLTVHQKSNGNFVMVHSSDCTNLLEIDENGSIVRQCKSEIVAGTVNFADNHERIVITDDRGSMELLDSEFNLIGIYGFQQDAGMYPIIIVLDVHFASERNEIVRRLLYCSATAAYEIVTIFRFTEE